MGGHRPHGSSLGRAGAVLTDEDDLSAVEPPLGRQLAERFRDLGGVRSQLATDGYWQLASRSSISW